MTIRIPLIIIPEADEPGAAEVYVRGTVNGQDYRFLLDTGAARSSIITDPFTASLPALGTHHSSGVFSTSHDDVVSVERLQIGPVVRQPFQLTRASGDAGPRGSLIGMDILKDHCCHFLFDRNELVPGEPTPVEACSWQPLLFDQKFHPYIDVHCGQAEGQAVWDSGASLTVVDIAFVERHPACFTEAGYSTGTDTNGSQVETAMFVMAAVQLGGVQFPPHRVAAVDLSQVNALIEIPMDLILGYNLYSQTNWLFDFPNRRWAITRTLQPA